MTEADTAKLERALSIEALVLVETLTSYAVLHARRDEVLSDAFERASVAAETGDLTTLSRVTTFVAITEDRCSDLKEAADQNAFGRYIELYGSMAAAEEGSDLIAEFLDDGPESDPSSNGAVPGPTLPILPEGEAL